MAFKFTIQTKLVSFFLLLSLMPLCIMGVIAFENGQKALKESIGAGLKDSAIQTMDKIDRSLSNRVEDIKAWASIGAMQDVAAGDPEGRITEVLTKLKKDYGIYSGIFCVDLNGKIIASSKRRTIGQDVSNETWFQEAVESPGVTIHGLEYSKLAGGFAVIFSIPIMASHGKSQVIGYLSSRFNWSELYEITNSVQVTNEGQNEVGYVLLIDDKGFVISGPGFILAEEEEEEEEDNYEKLSSRNLLSLGYQSAQRALQRQSGFLVETSPTGQEILAGYAGSKGYRDFEGFGWAVVIQHMTSEAFETVTQLRGQFIGIGLGVGFIAIIFAILVSRGISIPIQKLTDTARAISRGDLSRTIDIYSKDEIGTLADTLRHMMRELNRVIELERSNEALLNFASIASHDLQEPLRKISIFGDRLKNTAVLDERGRDYLERMQRSAERLREFIQDLLEFSKTSYTSRKLEAIDLNQVVADVVSDLEPRITQTNADLHIGKLPTLEVDKSQMTQLFQNLISNALKFHKKDHPPCVYINSQLIERWGWEIIVKDDGIGFEMKYRNRILLPFQRLHSRRKYEGNGLGLAICQKIVESHGGKLTAVSSPGYGAVFTVALPEDPLAEQKKPKPDRETTT